MISILNTLITWFIGIEPLNTLLLNLMVNIWGIFIGDFSEVCKPSPIIANSKAIIAL